MREASWVTAALRLPSAILQSLPASPETQDPAFVLTVLNDGQFFQLAYSDGTSLRGESHSHAHLGHGRRVSND